jgi:hypothetical protein
MQTPTPAELAVAANRADKAASIVRAWRRRHENTAAAIVDFDALDDLGWLRLRWAAKIQPPSPHTIQLARAMLIELLPAEERAKLPGYAITDSDRVLMHEIESGR